MCVCTLDNFDLAAPPSTAPLGDSNSGVHTSNDDKIGFSFERPNRRLVDMTCNDYKKE